MLIGDFFCLFSFAFCCRGGDETKGLVHANLKCSLTELHSHPQGDFCFQVLVVFVLVFLLQSWIVSRKFFAGSLSSALGAGVPRAQGIVKELTSAYQEQEIRMHLGANLVQVALCLQFVISKLYVFLSCLSCLHFGLLCIINTWKKSGYFILVSVNLSSVVPTDYYLRVQISLFPARKIQMIVLGSVFYPWCSQFWDRVGVQKSKHRKLRGWWLFQADSHGCSQTFYFSNVLEKIFSDNSALLIFVF